MSEPVWSVPRRVAFRFGVIAGALYLFPFPLGFIPKTESLAETLAKPWDWLVPWFAENLLGIDAPQRVPTGSGDTMYVWVQTLLLLILAAIGAALWSVIDRKRLAYPRLQAATIVTLRYFLCMTMLGYGVAKIFEGGQFSPPSLLRHDQSYGESSPMGLLWTFMGHSQPYTKFAGIAETLGGLLLLSRRTTTIGALVCAAVMTNVVMLNFCYDVPVKLFSSQLLLCALLILLPHARRVATALLGHAVGEVAPRTRGSTWFERARLAGKVGFCACLAYGAYTLVKMVDEMAPHKTELHGTWVVETFHADYVELPPLTTDEHRWRKLILSQRGTAVRAMTDKRTRYIGARVDPEAHTLTLPDAETNLDIVLRYQRVDDTHLMLEGVLDGKQVRITLVKEPDPLLTTRGFHWVQEFPFNR